jgi:hypothetical protein
LSICFFALNLTGAKFLIKNNMKKILLLSALPLVLLTGCAATSVTPQGQQVVIVQSMPQEYAGRCEFVGEVAGSQGNWITGNWTPNKNLALMATGYSAAHAVDVLKKRNVPADRIVFICLLCAPEGMKTFQELHPDIKVFTASLDDHLNEKAYIVPGLGDAGDRLFGTL